MFDKYDSIDSMFKFFCQKVLDLKEFWKQSWFLSN